jgi:hypothetical protein
VSFRRCAGRSHRPPALAELLDLRRHPESLRHPKPGGSASPDPDNPDWALVWEGVDRFAGAGEKLYLVRGTKGSATLSDPYLAEPQKVRCGARHFTGAPGVDFEVIPGAGGSPGGTAVGG